MAHGRIPPEFLPLQSGVGNINNAVMARLGKPKNPPFMMYSEVLQESVVHLLETGKISGASASSLTISADSASSSFFTTIWITLPAALCCVRRRFPITRAVESRRWGVIALNVGLDLIFTGMPTQHTRPV